MGHGGPDIPRPREPRHDNLPRKNGCSLTLGVPVAVATLLWLRWGRKVTTS